MDKVVMFNDGTMEAKILSYELRRQYTVREITVKTYTKLEDWIDKLSVDSNEITRVFLHFPFEYYVLKDIRTEMLELHRKHPNLRIIPYYEQADRKSLQHRAEKYNITSDIKLTGKPEAIAISEPEPKVEIKVQGGFEHTPTKFNIDLKEVAKNVVTEDKLPKTNEQIPKDFVENKAVPKKKRRFFNAI